MKGIGRIYLNYTQNMLQNIQQGVKKALFKNE